MAAESFAVAEARESLIRRVAKMAPGAPSEDALRTLGRPELSAERWDPEPEEAQPLPDGYVRRSPVQSYRTPVGFRKRQILEIVLTAALLCLAALLVLALMRSNFLGLI